MKKSVYMLLALAAVVACSKTDVVYDDAQTGEITVSPVASNITKAAITDAVYPEENHIALFAYHAPDVRATNWSNEDPKPTLDYTKFDETYLFNAEFKYESTDISTPKWSGLESSYYWPITGSVVFAGYSLPAPVEGATKSTQIGTAVRYDLTTDKLEIDGYKQSANTAETFDFLYFGRTGESFNNRRNGDPIQFVFNHALSLITIKVKGEAGTLVPGRVWSITDVTLKGVQTTGDFTYLGTATSPALVATWEVNEQATGTDVRVFGKLTKASSPVTPQPLTDDFEVIENVENGLVLIPQEAKELWVTVKYNSPAGQEITELIEVPLKTTATPSWEAGKRYTYQLTFNPQQITVTPTVSKWPSPGVEVTPNE